LFIEYKKAHQIKMDIVTGIVNCKLIDYFTEDKKKYIQDLLKQVTHASISTQTQDVDTQYTIFDSKVTKI